MKRLYTETEEIKITRKKTYVDIDDSYTQMYDSIGKLVVRCKSLHEINLMFFASVNSNANGYFSSNEDFYNKFNTHLKTNGGKTISRVSFTTTISNLVNNKILVKFSRGQYQLNPLLIWRDEIGKRNEEVVQIMSYPVEEKQKFLIESNLKQIKK